MSDWNETIQQMEADRRAAPCPTCGQYSHSLGDDKLTEAFMHFETMICENSMKPYPTGHMFDPETRDMAQALVAHAKVETAARVKAEAERDAAVEALRPFAKFAETFDKAPNRSQDDVIYEYTSNAGLSQLTLTDCRAARATLAKLAEQAPQPAGDGGGKGDE